MQLLKDRIRKDGKIKAGNVLKVDSFLNHQMDIDLFQEIGKEFKRRFEGVEINKILTIEASGIGIACVVAQSFHVPVVFAKKTQTKNIAGDVYTTQVESFTHGRVYDIIVAKEFLGEGDKVLIIDDFLANGKALEGLAELVQNSGAELAGAGIVIEKGFQVGGDIIRDKGIRLESLAIVESMDEETGTIVFRGDKALVRKALFFDVDGTLLSEVTRTVPESAERHWRLPAAAGHLVFINTGRAYSELGELKALFDPMIDGWLCGCGTYVEVGGKTLYHRVLPQELSLRIRKAIEDADMDGILEGKDGCYMGSPDSRFPMGRRFRKNLTHAIRSLNWAEYCGEAEKFCVMADEQSDRAGFFRGLGLDIDVIDRGNGFYECVPAGHSKATAIDVILDTYGLTLKEAYVFGDSTNDMSMFEHVPNAVLMGKHDKELEPYASFTTKNVEQDGIWYAMEKLGLLEP